MAVEPMDKDNAATISIPSRGSAKIGEAHSTSGFSGPGRILKP